MYTYIHIYVYIYIYICITTTTLCVLVLLYMYPCLCPHKAIYFQAPAVAPKEVAEGEARSKTIPASPSTLLRARAYIIYILDVVYA